MATDPKHSSCGNRSFRKAITPEILRRLYHDHTDAEIGDRYGVTQAAVAHWRKKWGIQTLTERERRDKVRRDQGLPCLEDLTPVKLLDLYGKMGDRAIGNLYGVSKPTISKLRRRWGIAPISKSQRAVSDRPLTEKQQEIVLGVLLGDGFLSKKGIFKVSHSHAQIRYLGHLYESLTPLSRPISFSEKHMDSGTVAYEFSLRTRMHQWFRSIRKLFYPQGSKIFPDSVLSQLAPRSLAYWYFDDGHLDSDLPSLALGDITEGEAQQVVQHLRDRFALDPYVASTSTPTCKIVKIRARTADVFFSLILPFVPVDLVYKIPRKFRPKGMTPIRPRLTKAKTPVPVDLQIRSKEHGHLDEAGKERLVNDLAEFWEREGFPYPLPRAEDLEVLHHLEERHIVKNDRIRRINVGQSICLAMMPHIWEAHPYGSKKSPLDTFRDPQDLRKVIRMLLRYGKVPTAGRVRNGVRFLRYSGAYNFRPAAAKVLVDRFCPPGGLVFDPCGGWGGRLLGTVLSTSLPVYWACEPQKSTFACLGRLRDWVGKYLKDVPTRVNLHCVPAEEFKFPSGVDVVMTSPPYWKKMNYGDDPFLAGNRYLTYEDWLENFWESVISKSIRSLKLGGWIVLNVDDVNIDGQRCPLIEDTIRIVRKMGFGEPEILKYDMARPDNPDNHEVVLCWAKGEGKTLSGTSPSLGVRYCTTCGRPVSVDQDICSMCFQKKENKKKTCEECGEVFTPQRRSARFCSDTCSARSRRRRYRELNPPKTTYLFTCQNCGRQWEESGPGGFRLCPDCKAQNKVQKREKVCAYRHCGESFTDTSPKNSMRFCCPDHRRKEKMFRTGQAKDLSYFRENRLQGQRTCQNCRQVFVQREGERNIRCPSCREKRRQKICQRCGIQYRDGSLNNTRRYCDSCRSPQS